MSKCETCGNEYYKTFEVIMDGGSHIFDSFECAIEKLAPRCSQCDTRVIGHGVEAEGQLFCCAHCAGMQGFKDLKDQSRSANV